MKKTLKTVFGSRIGALLCLIASTALIICITFFFIDIFKNNILTSFQSSLVISAAIIAGLFSIYGWNLMLDITIILWKEE